MFSALNFFKCYNESTQRESDGFRKEFRMKTIRLIYPQWQGGMNQRYYLGGKLLAALAPEDPAEKTFTVPVETGFDELEQVDGIDAEKVLMRQMKAVRNILDREEPDQIIVFGGDCSVSQVPFDYLSGRYGDDFGILWLDSHPDISGRHNSSHLHEYVLADLLGHAQDHPATHVGHPVPEDHILYVGLIEKDLRPTEKIVQEKHLSRLTPQHLADGPEPVLRWIREKGLTKVAVHWDLDILSPNDFHALTSAKPGMTREEYGAAVGEMTLAQVAGLLRAVSGEARMVGLSVAEHMPWDAFRLHDVFESLEIFHAG